MAINTDAPTSWHTVVPTALGELALVRDADALLGLYFPNHWYRPNPMTFGPRRADGFEEAIGSSASTSPGSAVTYGALARRLGGDVTPQQVGAAVGRNPLCIVLPCHRVVGAAGKLTGYAGGLARKRHLLDLEQTGLPPLVLPATGTLGVVAAR